MDLSEFKSIPVNSLLLIPEGERSGYLSLVFTLPKKTQDVLFTESTGSFVRGLGKSYDIPAESQGKIALSILEVAIGKKTVEQLPGVFSTELGVSPDAAKKMATEIERDVFGPLKNVPAQPSGPVRAAITYVGQSQPVKKASPNTIQIPKPAPKTPNVLNLKELQAPATKPTYLPSSPSPYEGEGKGMRLQPKPPKAPLPPLRFT